MPEPLSESYNEGRCLDDKYLIYKNSNNFETEWISLKENHTFANISTFTESRLFLTQNHAFYFCWHTGIYSKWFEHNQKIVADYACFPDDKLLTTLCGKQRNLTISSQSNSLVLVFTSDYFQEGRGFKIYARSRNANSSNRPRGPGNITTNKCSIEHHTWINCYHCNYIQ